MIRLVQAARSLLQDNQMLVAETDDQIHLGAGVMQGLGLGIGDGHAQTAADHRGPVNPLRMAGLPSGPTKSSSASPSSRVSSFSVV